MNVPNLSQTPVFHHACPFAERLALDGKVTSQSISRGQQALSDNVCIAGLRRQAVVNAVKDNPTVAGLCATAGNPARSGIWNEDCTLNPQRLKQLKDLCIQVDGALFLTRAIFQTFVDERRATLNKTCLPDTLAFGNLTYVGCLPVPYTKVTDGSIDALFHAFARFELGGEKLIKWNSVSTFYDPDNSAKLREG